jgi:hypothetical protein
MELWGPKLMSPVGRMHLDLHFHVNCHHCIVHFAQIFDIATTNALRTSQKRLSYFFCCAFKFFLQAITWNRIFNSLEKHHESSIGEKELGSQYHEHGSIQTT